ncbi:MAG TPA: SCO family protein [Steroidobacteraceae bacterium]|jgi:protein SCO1/2
MRIPPSFNCEAKRASAMRLGTFLLSLVFLAPVFAGDDALKAGVFSPPRIAPDFTLRGSNGSDLVFSRYRGKVVLLSFGYTSCTEVCPVTLALLALARKQLGAAGADLQVVYVTVDPERDSAKRMHDYLSNFDPSFIGGTGTAEQLAAVRKDYGIIATKVPTPDGYAMAHSSFVYLVDRGGSLRAMMPFGHSVDDYVHDVKQLLKQ